MQKFVKLITDNIQYPALLAIILIAAWIRALNWDPNIILDYDPWWFFRHAQEIIENGGISYKWDLLSFYPPGRPVDYYLGWSYTIAAFYAMTSAFIEISLTKFAGIFIAIFAGACAIPAYLVGKHVTNRWGGLTTAFFTVLTVTFISVSIAGYPDSDAVDVFYTFTSIITTLYAIKKADKMDFTSRNGFFKSLIKYAPYAVPALISYWLFAFNWSSSWYIYFIFVVFIPMLIAFRVIESLVRTLLWKSREASIGLGLIISKIRENRSLIFAILFIGFVGELVTIFTSGWPFNTAPPHDQLMLGLNIIGTKGIAQYGFVAAFALTGAVCGIAFGRRMAALFGATMGAAIAIAIILSGVTGQALIVNQSVAELQVIGDIFTGFNQIMARVGPIPMVLAFAAIAITMAKIVFRKEIHTAEYFAIIWLIISLFLITKGIRFSLLFSMAVATAAGFTVGNLIEFAKGRRNYVLLGGIFAFVMIAGLMQFNDTYGFSKAAGGGLDVSPNFRAGFEWIKNNTETDSLITTWWDPGHIIAGATGRKVMADGAHCGFRSCAFLNHNDRIQDMGAAFALGNEEESARILSKYMGITRDQCAQLRERFRDLFTEESCKPVSNMYVLATSDLIGKYYWLSFFGTQQGANYNICNYNQAESQRLNAPTYVCNAGVPMEISLVQTNTTIIAVMNSPQQGARNAPVNGLILYNSNTGQQMHFRPNVTTAVDGMVWVDPSYGYLVFMNANVRQSVFTNMFFLDGKGEPAAGIAPLTRYEMVYENPEFKVFRVNFTGITLPQDE